MSKIEIIYNEYIEKYVAIVSDEDECVSPHMENLDKDEVEIFIKRIKEAYPDIMIIRMD